MTTCYQTPQRLIIWILLAISPSIASASSDPEEQDSPGISQEEGFLDYLGSDDDSQREPTYDEITESEAAWQLRKGDRFVTGSGYPGVILGIFADDTLSIRYDVNGSIATVATNRIALSRGCIHNTAFCFGTKIVTRSGYTGTISGIFEDMKRVMIQYDINDRHWRFYLNNIAIITD